MRARPPKKQAGHATGRRRFDGAFRDVAGLAQYLGASEKTIRAGVARHLIPHRRLGGRIVFPLVEIDRWLAQLPGLGAADAVANARARQRGT
jgi:excisionase family DNA binding protein